MDVLVRDKLEIRNISKKFADAGAGVLNGVSFTVSGSEDAQITVGLQDDTEYDVSVGGTDIGRMKTNMGGKLVVSLELSDDEEKAVTITRA